MKSIPKNTVKLHYHQYLGPETLTTEYKIPWFSNISLFFSKRILKKRPC